MRWVQNPIDLDRSFSRNHGFNKFIVFQYAFQYFVNNFQYFYIFLCVFITLPQEVRNTRGNLRLIIANNRSMLVGFRPKVDIVSDIWSGILS